MSQVAAFADKDDTFVASVDKIKRLRYDEMVAHKSTEVFILNKANTIYNQPATMVVAVAWGGSTGGNKEESITIPTTWIPIPLTDLLSKEDIIGNQHFRTLSSQGIIWFMDPVASRNFIENNVDAAAALALWQRQRQAISVTGQPLEDPVKNMPIGGMTNPSGTQIVLANDPNDPNTQNPQAAQQQNTLRPIVSEIVRRPDLSQPERDEAVRNHIGSMTPTEANWLLGAGQFGENVRDMLTAVAKIPG